MIYANRTIASFSLVALIGRQMSILFHFVYIKHGLDSIFPLLHLTILLTFLDIQVSVSCNDCMATLLIVNTQNNFHFEQIKQSNELCSDDLHHTRVQCALFDICSKKNHSITAPPV